MENESKDNAGAINKQDWYRSGPKPLSIHLNIALSRLSKGEIRKDQVEQLIAGIKKYQSYPYKRCIEPLNIAWSSSNTNLYFLPSRLQEPLATIFIIPSMINKSHILDLMPDHSFVRWLSDQGCNVYLLDWGELVSNPNTQSFDSAVTHILNPAIEYIQSQSRDHSIYCLGYCMGGLFSLFAAYFNQHSIKGLVLLASPWCFESGDQTLRELAFKNYQVAKNIIEEKGFLPSDWIQTLFASVDPEFSYKKFSHFLTLDAESVNKEKRFVIVEDWLNDGVDLPRSVALTCLDNLYNRNESYRCELVVDKTIMNPLKLSLPTLIIASKKDILVPYESSIALAEQIQNAKVLSPSIGHIGMMTSDKAIDIVWKPIIKWISETEENSCIS